MLKKLMIVITSWCIIIQKSLVFFNNVVKCAFWVLTTGHINLPYLMFNLIIIINWNHCAQPKLHRLESGTNGYKQPLDFFFFIDIAIQEYIDLKWSDCIDLRHCDRQLHSPLLTVLFDMFVSYLLFKPR